MEIIRCLFVGVVLVGVVGGLKYSTPSTPSQNSEFVCPEDFGYFPHPSDCSQYYVCVFGGALLESCTGGLQYSHDLQTCDWPRNVNKLHCSNNQTVVIETNLITTTPPQLRSRRPTKPTPTISSDYVYKPIRVENYGDLGVINREENNEGGRSGRSYAQSGPEKEWGGKEKLSGRSVGGHTPSKTNYSPQIDSSPNDFYTNQRYAANTNYSLPEDDDTYYVYEDNPEEEIYYPPVTTTTTKRPKIKPPTTPTPPRARPTLKSKSQIVKEPQPVRDVYLDSPTRPRPFYATPTPNTPAVKCQKDVCLIPDCNCGGKDIPGGLRAEETPQIVLLTFDDSVNDLNKNLYRDLFEKGRKNPNGCPISATFYVSHEWTDYSQVQNLAADGHEIASHSVSHSFGESFSQKKWEKEINGQREILSAYGGVKLSEVRGMRAPFLAIGGNNMFKMLHDVNFTYDSSMPVYENRPPSWPYTLDYKIFHDCMIPPCPTKSYPGVWEVPMVMWQDLKGGRCSMGDACSNPPDAEGVYQMLAKNFERHYTTNRAPFGLYYHAAWFTQTHHKEGFEAFLDTLVQMDDVWLVTNWQALSWIRNPTSTSRINSFEPWNECRGQEHRPPRCNHPRVCNLWHKSGVRYMKTCQTCPAQYPWTGNTGVPFTI